VAWECGGMAAAANGTAGAWKGNGATIPAARLTQTTCGRESRCTQRQAGCYEDVFITSVMVSAGLCCVVGAIGQKLEILD
jgi:hypothetical protein